MAQSQHHATIQCQRPTLQVGMGSGYKLVRVHERQRLHLQQFLRRHHFLESPDTQ